MKMLIFFASLSQDAVRQIFVRLAAAEEIPTLQMAERFDGVSDLGWFIQTRVTELFLCFW